jgi:hypothetical protein
MKVYATMLPLKPEITREKFIDTVFRWLGEVPSFEIKDALSDIDKERDFCEIKTAAAVFKLANVKKGADRVTAIRIEYYAPTNWITSIILVESNERRYVKTEVEQFKKEYESRYPAPFQTDSIRFMLENDFFEVGKGFKISDKPIYTSDQNIEKVAGVMNGQSDITFPMAYISLINDSSGHEVDADKMAKELCGIAYVVAEKNSDHSLRLRERTDGQNPYNGFIGLYYQRTNYSQKFHIKEDMSARRLEDYIIVSARRTAWAKVDETWSWVTITAELRKNREIDEFSSSFDAENERLRIENEKLKEQVRILEEDKYGLKVQCENLKDALSRDKECQGNLIVPSEIKEFFDCEQQDLIITVLEAALLKMNDDNRDYELLFDILQRNKLKGNGLPVLEAIEQLFKDGDRIGQREISQLERYGFEIVSDNTHYKIVYQGNPQYAFTLEKTPSDHRYGRNMISDITKKLSVYKKR